MRVECASWESFTREGVEVRQPGSVRAGRTHRLGIARASGVQLDNQQWHKLRQWGNCLYWWSATDKIYLRERGKYRLEIVRRGECTNWKLPVRVECARCLQGEAAPESCSHVGKRSRE